MKELPLPNRFTAIELLCALAVRRPSNAPQPVDRPLILYGAGNLGRLAAQLLALLHIPVAYAIDQTPPADGLLLGRIPVLKPDMAPATHRESHLVAVCVVLAPYTPILESLADMGWHNVCPLYDITEAYAEQVPMGNGWFSGVIGANEKESLRKVLQSWSDDVSRAAHLQFLAWRSHREEWDFTDAPVNTKDRYFPDFICKILGDNEIFLDAGAYVGDVSLQFDAITQGRHAGLIAIEADPAISAQLLNRLTNFAHPIAREKVQAFNYALGKENNNVPFCSALGMGSRIFAAGNTRVESRRLDDLDLTFTFAKLHLEGGELNAISGGLASIKRNRPILAVTVYHSRDGLFEIPLLLMTQLDDYRFFLRVHAWCGTGVVLYAIPEERFHKGQ